MEYKVGKGVKITGCRFNGTRVCCDMCELGNDYEECRGFRERNHVIRIYFEEAGERRA